MNKTKNRNKIVYKELYGKYDTKVASDKKIEEFKWRFIASNKRESNERKHNGM